MITDEDIIKKIADNKMYVGEKEVKDFLRVTLKYLKKLAEEDNHELIELPYIGFLYKKLDQYNEKEKKGKTFEKKYLRSIYEYAKPNEKNFYTEENYLKKKYNVETKEQLQEALDNPSFKK
jgi:hypothetical protein